MRFVLVAVALLLICALVYLDYRWKRWMAKRREERIGAGDEFRR